jgi:mannan endo-1,4-beta-mannosidase
LSQAVVSMKGVLLLGLAASALTAAIPCDDASSHGIEDDDFVYVKGLRLYDSKGLHYLTGKLDL